MEFSTKAADKLQQELTQRCFDAGIGFRITITRNERDNLEAVMRFDRRRAGDIAHVVSNVNIFCDAETEVLVQSYDMSFLDGPGGGFFLTKKQGS